MTQYIDDIGRAISYLNARLKQPEDEMVPLERKRI